MKSRRAFLSDLAVGLACLCVRFRPECSEVAKARVVYSGEWGEFKYTISTAFRPVHPMPFPIIVHRFAK